MATSNDVAPNSIGWHILEGYPWWPVYICDATKLRPKLHYLGAGHKNILRKARDFPKDYRLVYFFGSHDFQQVRLNKGIVLKPWDCAEKENFLKGHPKHLIKKKSTLDELQFAIQEAEDYLSTPDDIRLPPCMVPSDLDPTLEPPPEIEREELMEEDDDAGDDDAGSGHEDGDGDQDDNEDEDMSGGSDNESKSKSKKKSSSAKKPTKEKKPAKEKKAAKEKKPAKEKKAASKPKKEKESASSSKDKKEKKATTKKDKEPTAAASQEDKKRKKPAASDESSAAATTNGSEASPKAASPSKVAKKEKAADVKSDAKPSKAEKKAKSSGSELSGEALSAVLEKEIKWILANCQFEEMTTKTVRKLLEKRLNMDLRHHKASIKEGVARVIASMEDGTDGAAGGSEGDGDVAMKSEADVPEQPPAPSSPAPLAPPAEAVDAADAADAVKEEIAPPAAPTDDAEPEKQDDEPKPVAENEEPEVKKEDASTQVAQRLADAERELGLALSDEPKLVKALTALQQQLPTVEKEALANSTALVAKLVELRAHEETSVSKLAASIAKQWDAEDLVPAPKPIREEDILEMKEKLENAETSHEDMLACLNQLATMRLQMSHLKNTGIARAVANLRQHANDKVSIAAINLRKSWIQLTKLKTDSGSDVDRVKSLEGMNRILEQKDNQEGESSHLAVLEKLQGMTLSTQDIIKSKIGVVVSKLRKSSNEKVAKAATLLRKKWKAEAAA